MKLAVAIWQRLRPPPARCRVCSGERRIDTGIVLGETRYEPCPNCTRR